ncbi:MAG: CYTH domain-containing protein [Clostridia bacterium]|nr:CYTH domain-containing protein [Clostridia bacterium]
MIKEPNREYELKLMLSEEEYINIDTLFTGSTITQVNHYFDTPGFDLYKKKIVVRLRQKKNTSEITVKTANPGTTDEGIVDMVERTIKIDKREAGLLLEGKIRIAMYLLAYADLPNDDLIEIGEIATTRKIIILDKKLPPAELDKNIYGGITDYELEWELDEMDYGKARDALMSIGLILEGRLTGLSKYGRLVKSLMKGNR